MIFESTYGPNLEKRTINHEINESINVDQYENHPLSELTALIKTAAKHNKIAESEIKFYSKLVEVDEFGKTERHLVLYYEKEETDAEYNTRIQALKVTDLKNSINEVNKYQSCALQRVELCKLYNELVVIGKYKGLKSERFEQFLSEESFEEKLKTAEDKGFKEGSKQLKEFKAKLKDL